MRLTTNTLSLLESGIRAESSAVHKKAKAFDAIFADGGRSEHLTKKSEQFDAELFDQVESAIIAAVFTKAEASLFAMGAKAAKEINQSDARNKLSSVLSKYIGNVRAALDARAVSAGEKPAKAAKAKQDTSGVPEKGTEQAESVKSEIGTVNPGTDIASYKEALNLMIIATRCHEDKRIQANADSFCEVFSEMLKTLKA